ncbi:MAG TPA: phosphotransferase [Acidimicrobiia bacterium]|nr:phosphotransferase [Acidimicrobiia bacterium]
MTDSNPTLAHLLAAMRVADSTPDLEWAVVPAPLSGGFWAQMWRIRLAGARPELSRELVARVMPSARVAARETLVQDQLARVGFATPAVRLAGEPGPQLDRAWMVMDLAPGRTLLAGLSGPSALLRLPRIARDMPDRLATLAAALHTIDADDIARALDADDEVGDLLARLDDQTTSLGFTDLALLARWLRRHRPAGHRRAVCHGDLHPFNVLSAPSGDTVVDWSSALIADPAFDLAFTSLLLAHPPLAAPRPVQPVVNLAGRALSRRFLRTYAARSTTAINADQLEWFTLLHALRVLTEVATWEDQDELGDHAGHPFLTLRAPLAGRVNAATDVVLRPVAVA